MYTLKHLKKITTATCIVLLICVLFYACKEKYLPVVKDINPNYLVVDGFINTGADSTIFKLSRTFKLESKAVTSPEKAAIVTIESDAGLKYPLPELALKAGTYATPALNLDQTKKYRLRIRTKDGKEYLSEFVESKVSPQLEISYDFRHGNLNIYTNTQDPTGNSRYYNYAYVETWQYQSKQTSLFKIENHEVKPRLFPQDDIHNCYHIVPSATINVASTAALTQDKVADNLIEEVAPTSEKVGIEYSILVTQTVLTRAGFDFYTTLKKNTESVGSIFDAQPSQLFGNIYCVTNPTDVIIGFISAGTTTQKRITLLAKNFPFFFSGNLTDSYCDNANDTLYISKGEVKRYLTDPVKSEYVPLDAISGPSGIIAYIATKLIDCADCRLKGGTNVMPSYWIH